MVNTVPMAESRSDGAIDAQLKRISETLQAATRKWKEAERMSKAIYVARNNPDGGTSFLRVPVDEYEWARQHALEIAGNEFTASELELLDHGLKLSFCLRRENIACLTCGQKTFVRIPIYLVDYDMQAERNAAGFRDINLLLRDEAKIRLAEFVVNAVSRIKNNSFDIRNAPALMGVMQWALDFIEQIIDGELTKDGYISPETKEQYARAKAVFDSAQLAMLANSGRTA